MTATRIGQNITIPVNDRTTGKLEHYTCTITDDISGTKDGMGETWPVGTYRAYFVDAAGVQTYLIVSESDFTQQGES